MRRQSRRYPALRKAVHPSDSADIDARAQDFDRSETFLNRTAKLDDDGDRDKRHIVSIGQGLMPQKWVKSVLAKTNPRPNQTIGF